MSRILITGSSDGFGLVAAQQLIAKGHTVYLHARSSQRATDAEKACPGAAGTLIADLSSLSETKKFASEANALGPFDVIIHNAGVFLGPTRRTADTNMPTQVFVNVLAPYILTCLMHKPKRLIYISSMLHKQGDPANVEDMLWEKRGEDEWNDFKSYCDTKLQLNLFANVVAKKWKGETSVATVHPGWVATKLGGKEAPDRLEDGVETYVKLALGEYDQGLIAPYFEPKGKLGEQIAAAGDEELQQKVVKLLEEKTGLKIPA
ncbi:hypothetical protein BDW74DRAFT_188496 [Aspergillus multicolor]|uniref:uncharacterized protein n=1 Tax=Aspergillus multicolor TaxID=41759 RepID=UPI003CCD2AE1